MFFIKSIKKQPRLLFIIIIVVLFFTGCGPEVSELVDDLKDEDWKVRRDAADALRERGDASAVEPLIEALEDDNQYVRVHIAFALGEIGDARAVEPLIDALEDRDRFLRRSAAWALGKIGDNRAIDPLLTAFEEDDKLDVRKDAARALNKLGWKPNLLFKDDDGEVLADGNELGLSSVEVYPDTYRDGYYQVVVEFENREGLHQFTASQTGNQVIISLEEHILMSPTVREPITEGSLIIFSGPKEKCEPIALVLGWDG